MPIQKKAYETNMQSWYEFIALLLLKFDFEWKNTEGIIV